MTLVDKIEGALALMMHFEEDEQVYQQFKEDPTESNMMGEA